MPAGGAEDPEQERALGLPVHAAGRVAVAVAVADAVVSAAGAVLAVAHLGGRGAVVVARAGGRGRGTHLILFPILGHN